MQHSESLTKLAAAAPLLVGEVWCGLLNAPDYLIGSDGRVLSLVGRRARVLRPSRTGKYPSVGIRRTDGRTRTHYVHRLVLEAFYGPPGAGQEARHLDGDPTNNTLANLAWGTRHENHADKRVHGTSAAGERNPMAKLSRADVARMRATYAAGGWTYRRLGAEFGVSTMTALRAVKGESWS